MKHNKIYSFLATAILLSSVAIAEDQPPHPPSPQEESASFTFAGKISDEREAPDAATFDESIAEGAMDEEKGAADGRLAADRKLAEKVNEAEESAFAQLYSLDTQMPRSGVGSPVHLEVVGLLQNFELAPTKDLLTAKKSGLYYLMLTAQPGTKPPGSNGYVDCWFVQNGKPVKDSNLRQSIESGNFTGLMNTAFLLRMEAGDTLGVVLSASGPSLGLLPNRVQNEPAISSIDLLIYKIGWAAR